MSPNIIDLPCDLWVYESSREDNNDGDIDDDDNDDDRTSMVK